MMPVIAGIALFAYSCGDGKCSVDKDCSRGFVCENSSCTVRKCESIADCNAGQICVPVGGEKVCTAQECSVAEDCNDAAKVCENGLCVPKVEGDVFEDGEVFEEIGETTDVPTTEEVITQTSTSCKACTKKEECGTGNFCSMFGGGKYCLSPCGNMGDCPSGYMCYPVSSDGNQCVPVSYSCKDCAQNGCEPGKYCNFITGECIVPKAQCEKCQYDFECGLGSRCYKAKPGDQNGNCVPECGKAACADAVNFTCADVGTGTNLVKLCTPVGGKCGDCPIEKPYKFNEECVQCLNSTHCTPPATCDQNTHTCTSSPECPGTTPNKCSDDKCHQCCDDSHCKGIGEEKCDLTTYTCKGAQCTDPCGCICVDPYPACVVINGNPSCVQCDGITFKCDDPCSCNTQIYYCEHPQGLSCVGTQPKCQNDADCPPSETYPNIKCHSKGFCYDPGGGCDNVSAYCDEASGSTCFDILSSLFGGGLPIPGGQGFPGLGYCTCNPGTCPDPSTQCTPMSFICLLLPDLCAGSTPPNICGDLLGGLLGGGGLPF